MKNQTEIEIKARTANPEACKKNMDAFAGEGTAFSKDDSYWFAGEHCGKAYKLPHSGLRLRQSKTGGTVRNQLTWKYKEKRDEFEINEEHEIELSSGAEAEQLLAMLSLEKQIVKTKQGWVWHYSGITAELCEVSGSVISGDIKKLGWFLELEILAENDSAETVMAAKEKLLSLLEKAGIGKENLESRYYSEMLSTAQ